MRTFLNVAEVDFKGALRSYQISNMDNFVKIINVFQSLTVFGKESILYVWQGSIYAYENQQQHSSLVLIWNEATFMPRGGIKIRAYNLSRSLLVSFSEGLNNIFSQCIKSTYKHFARALPKMFVYCPCTNALNLGAVTINWRKFLGTNGKK